MSVIIDNVKYYPKKATTPLKAIKFFCFECMGWDRQKPMSSPKPYPDVRQCTDEMCPLFEFRLGKNPYLKRKGQKGNLDALKKARKVREDSKRK